MTHEEHRHHQDLHGVDYERRDVNLKVTALIGLAIVALVAVFLVFVNEYFMVVKEDTVHQTALAPLNPKLLEVHASEEQILTQYKILDAGKGIYQIPIDRAIDLLVLEAGTTPVK